MATISVLYITKNEQEHIKKSIDSIVAIADEIIIIDAESKDKTINICRQYKKAKLFNHAWVHDYSKSRNFGLSKCTSDWIMVIDADEYVDARSLSEIKKAVETASPQKVGFAIRIAAYANDWDQFGEECDPYFPSRQVRIFRNDSRIKFSGKVCESVRPSIDAIGGTIDLIDATYHHHLWHGKGEAYGLMKQKYYKQLGSVIVPEKLESPVFEGEGSRGLEKAEAPVLAVVMVGFNCVRHTQKALDSLQIATELNHIIYFTNNGSMDETGSLVKNRANIEVTTFSLNQGASKGKNASLRKAIDSGAEYILICDNDVQFTQGSIDEMLKVIEFSEQTGIVGPISNTADGAQHLPDIIEENTVHMLPELIGTRTPTQVQVDSIGGFCMLIRRRVFEKLGGFEEGFGLYGYEDLDFCIRAKKANFDIVVANRSFVFHRGKTVVQEHPHNNWFNAHQIANERFKQKWNRIPSAPQGSAAQFSRVPPKTPKFSIIILTHNRWDVTKECLDSVVKYTKNYELIIVDNASKDGTPSQIRRQFPDAKVLVQQTNLGVPKGRNVGIKAATTDFLILMDNDVVVREGWLNQYYEKMKEGYDIVGLEAWQLDSNHAACYKCQNQSERFDYLGGACCLFKRSVFETVGLLDEGFSPAYYEDPDICIRAKKAGLQLAWIPTNRIEHKEHQTLIHGQKDFSYNTALSNSYVRFRDKMNNRITVEHEILPKLQKRLRIMYLGMEWDYGVRERGLSFEHDNFYPALMGYSKTKDLYHFDFVDMSKTLGVGKMTDRLYEEVVKFGPDVIFFVPFQEQFDPRMQVFKRIANTTSTKTVAWFCDSHWRYDNFDRKWADYVDFCTTTSIVAHQKYLRDGLQDKVIKTQWAASPKYKRMDVPKDIGISFVGQPHGDRRSVIDRIRAHGIGIQTYGTGWEKRLSFDEMITMFGRSVINLNLNNGADVNHKQIKGRNFEVPACGGFLLTGVAENLSDYYEFGKEIDTYDGFDDMIDKINFYLKNPEKAQQIADAGYERTMKDHTYECRFNDIFKKMELL